MDKWLTLGITVDQARAFRLIEDACRDAGDYGFFSRVTKLLQQWPDAINIEYAGACDMCHRDGLLSFRLPHHEPGIDEDVLKFYGYFCPHCNYSNTERQNEDVAIPPAVHDFDMVSKFNMMFVCPICGLPKVHYRLYGYRCPNRDHN